MIVPIGRPPPNEQRRFIHKKLLGIGASFAGVLPGIGTALGVARGAVTGFRQLTGGGPRVPARAIVPRAQTARVSRFSDAEKRLGQQVKFGGGAGPPLSAAGGGGCVFPFRRDPRTGECRIFLGDQTGPNGNGRAGGDGAALPLGEPVMGRYGAGVVPGSMVIDRAVCGKGMQLGDDGVCYNKSQISNKQRMWPRGRRPLLTGGEMRAISIASRSGKRLDSTSSKLRAMGMMKPLPKRSSKKCPPGRAAAPGTTIVQN